MKPTKVCQHCDGDGWNDKLHDKTPCHYCGGDGVVLAEEEKPLAKGKPTDTSLRVIRICNGCLNNKPGMCHVPECIYCRRTADELPLEFNLMSEPLESEVNRVLDKLIEKLAEIDDAGRKPLFPEDIGGAIEELRGEE